ncbi:hypothetical protein [Streptosporangium roseum]|uniref:FtsK domain-containing protein n=1 Tax=Streptosporangium roseum (strain ATCC 12428 / DSM 43021 / JCM 3005 / KCTC 9067 / NCIMB 10171 / NRRL 2505 / NI 9100) TaxID=479432 RepID=D2BFV8_STRRD|nr:hypothetical protein [Streptosporangium roseum]ACZ92010.1 hypothetical protein Sros_9392 [Streptosporangium roseum DSM 43021]
MGRRNKTKQATAQVVPVESVDAGRMGGGWLLVHGLPLITPGIGCAIFAILIMLAHAKWGGDAVWTPLLSILFLAVGGLITFFGHMSAGPRMLLRILMVVTGSLATGALVLGLVVGMGAIWPAYTLCSLIVWVLWVIWRGTKYAGATPATEGAGNPLMEAIKQARVQFAAPTVDERGVVRAKVETLPGGTMENARALMPMISAESRAVPGSTNLAVDLDEDGRGVIEIATRDNLKHGVDWPGLAGLKLGALPTEPFAIGEYQTGPCQVQIVGDITKDRRAPDIKHLKLGGVTGSGKSTGARTFLGSQMAMRRLNIIGLDLSKGLQTFSPFVNGLTWTITNEEEARQFLHRLKNVVIKGRSDHLTGEDLMRWSPASSLNLLQIWVEESKEFRKLQSLYADVVADARSAGVFFVSSTQHWNFRHASTDTRSNHGAAIMFGVEKYDEAEQILPKDALEALGKNLQYWGSNRPGYCYATGLGIPMNRWGSMLRIYEPTTEQLAEVVRVGAAYRDPMDPVTAELFGELFTNRTRYPLNGSESLQGAAPASRASVTLTGSTPGHSAPQGAAPASVRRSGAAAGDEEQEMAEMAEQETAEDREAMRQALRDSRRYHLGEDARPGDLADVDAEEVLSGVIVPAEGEEDDDEQAPRPSPEEAQRIWDEALDGWYREGRTHLRTADLVELLDTVRRDRRFLYRQRDRWESKGCITPRPDADGWDLIASPMETAGR